jgi:hypothetical protein
MSAALALLKGTAISSAETANPPIFMIVPRDEQFPDVTFAAFAAAREFKIAFAIAFARPVATMPQSRWKGIQDIHSMIWLAFEPDHEPVAFTFGYGCRIRLAAGPCLLLTDTVEKGKNEPIEIFACTSVETGIS